jgi:hypothetical protein
MKDEIWLKLIIFTCGEVRYETHQRYNVYRDNFINKGLSSEEAYQVAITMPKYKLPYIVFEVI